MAELNKIYYIPKKSMMNKEESYILDIRNQIFKLIKELFEQESNAVYY